MERGPRGINFQITRPPLPAPEDNHSWIGGEIVHCTVDMAYDDKVGLALKAGGIGRNTEM